MRIRYRILTGQMDRREFANVAEDIDTRGYSAEPEEDFRSPLSLLLALFETPRKVIECDGEDELSAVQAMLRDGRMGSHDLVDSGAGWGEARDFEPLAETCEQVERLARKRRLKRRVAIVVLSVLGCLGIWLAAR
ncbi:MAG TPA: hypothetical protein VGK67_02525 [Myxococcales bacterium]|jgi:hypothetical protein